jgi:hypothetical protein
MARRGRENTEHLFSTYDSYSLQEHQLGQMAAAIVDAEAEEIRTGDVEELVKRFADQFSLEAPTLLEGALSITADEAQVDVRGNYKFDAFGAGPTYVAGIRVCYYVPYFGDRAMFRCSASTRNLSMPPVELGDDELTFTFERPDQDVGATKADFDRELLHVKQSLEWLRQDFLRFNAALPAHVREKIVARRARLDQMTQGVQSLGVAIKRPTTAAPVVGISRRPTRSRGESTRRTKEENYDIALSFAGENRPYVEEVAMGLKAAGVSVFYDGFEQANLWGKNLIDHLAQVYRNARYVVMFSSKEYVQKVWTKHERKHAQDRELFAQEEYILPARFDDTPVPGITRTVASVDLRQTSAAELVDLILKKLRRM